MINSIIQSTEIPEQNEKSANEYVVVYQRQGLEAIRNNYYSILNIAQQCPSSGGKSVYLMRNLIALLNDSIQYNDVIACLQQGVYKQANENKKEEQQPSFLIVPNPASNEIEIRMINFYGSNCNISIRNELGQQVLNKKLNCDEKIQKLNIQSIGEGFYFVVIKTDSSD